MTKTLEDLRCSVVDYDGTKVLMPDPKGKYITYNAAKEYFDSQAVRESELIAKIQAQEELIEAHQKLLKRYRREPLVIDNRRIDDNNSKDNS